jgi:hypothetical protein
MQIKLSVYFLIPRCLLPNRLLAIRNVTVKACKNTQIHEREVKWQIKNAEFPAF